MLSLHSKCLSPASLSRGAFLPLVRGTFLPLVRGTSLPLVRGTFGACLPAVPLGRNESAVSPVRAEYIRIGREPYLMAGNSFISPVRAE